VPYAETFSQLVLKREAPQFKFTRTPSIAIIDKAKQEERREKKAAAIITHLEDANHTFSKFKNDEI